MRVNLEAQTAKRLALQIRRKKGVSAHRAGDLAHAHAFQPGFHPLEMTRKFRVKTGHLQAEAGGLGVDAVGAPHAQRALVAAGQTFQGLQQSAQVLKNQLAGLNQQQGVGRVHNVRGSAAQMDKAGLRPHLFLQRGQEGDDVMTRGFLNAQDAFHVNVRLVADRVHGLDRNAAQFGPGLAHGHFHREPGPVTVFQGPDPTHFRPGVAFDHGFLVDV